MCILLYTISIYYYIMSNRISVLSQSYNITIYKQTAVVCTKCTDIVYGIIIV